MPVYRSALLRFADDGRALYLRLATLTGEHNFFTRYEDAAVVARALETRRKKKAITDDADSTDSNK